MIAIPDGIEKIGFFTDLHGNDLNLIEMLNSNSDVAHWFTCGDTIDMSGKPYNNLPTIRIVKKNNIGCILGNHESDLLKYIQLKKEYLKETDFLKFLSSLPFILELKFSEFKITLVHSTPNNINEFINPMKVMKYLREPLNRFQVI